jgi:hypothetical protein
VTEPRRGGSIDEIASYIRDNRATYTDDAIRERLRAAGHPGSAIDDAFAMIRANDRNSPPAQRRWRLALGYTTALFVLTFLVFAFFSGVGSGMFGGLVLAILAIALFGGLMVSLVALRWNRDVIVAGSTGAIAVLLVPFVVVVIIGGLCIYSMNPSFPGPQPPTATPAGPQEEPAQPSAGEPAP